MSRMLIGGVEIHELQDLGARVASLLAIVVPAAANAAKPVYGDWGYDPAAMDRSVKPGDDFWAYVNGTWDKNTPDRSRPRFGGSVRDLVRQIREGRRADRRELRQRARTATCLGQQVGDFYASFMDEAAIEAAGTAPLKPYLAEINAAKTRAQLHRAVREARLRQLRSTSASMPISRIPTRYSAFAGQARLGMPSREYYLDDSAKMKAHRAAYRDYIIDIEKLAGLPAEPKRGRSDHRARDRDCRRRSGRPPTAATSTRSTIR